MGQGHNRTTPGMVATSSAVLFIADMRANDRNTASKFARTKLPVATLHETERRRVAKAAV